MKNRDRGILFDVSHKCTFTSLFLFPVNSNEAEYVTVYLQKLLISLNHGRWIEFLLKLVDFLDFIVAHNVEFDKKWFGKGRLPRLNKKWICSLEDINWSFQNH